MEELPTDHPAERSTPTESVEPMPENASVRKVPSRRPSVLREIFKKSNRTFWSWWGIPDIADDIETHGTAVKKAAISIFLSVMMLIVFSVAFGIKGWIDDGQMESTRGDLEKSQGATLEAERDRDKYQTLYNQDENAIGPFRQLANAKYAQAPPDQRVDLLLKKLESLQDDIDAKIQSVNPLNQNIAVAIAEINIAWKTDSTQQPAQGSVQAIVFGKGDVPILIAANGGVSMASTGNGPGWASLSTSYQLAPNSPSGFPISNLRDAQFIQIEFSPPNSVILGGRVRWTINSNTVLDFDIPPQTANGSHVFIRDIETGLKPLWSTPDKSPSPP